MWRLPDGKDDKKSRSQFIAPHTNLSKARIARNTHGCFRQTKFKTNLMVILYCGPKQQKSVLDISNGTTRTWALICFYTSNQHFPGQRMACDKRKISIHVHTSSDLSKHFSNFIFIHIQWHLSILLHNTMKRKLGHYNDVIMSAMVSQITSLTIVYSTVYSGVDQRNHQSFASLAFVGEFTGPQIASNAENVSILMTSSWWISAPFF